MSIKKSILATLAYHDLFDYPLTLGEIHRYLIKTRSVFKLVDRTILKLLAEKKIEEIGGYFFLRGRRQIVLKRKLRRKYSLAKFKRAIFFANLLKVIPCIKLIAVSGALSMENSHKNDDIDLVLITSKKRLWTCRFFANLVLFPFKRSPGRIGVRENISDKACLNVLIDESALMITPHNLYLAHEICQMRPMWDRENTYQKFIRVNSWVKRFLPNWRPTMGGLTTNVKHKSTQALIARPLALVARLFEALAKWGQLWYMRNKITTEKITRSQLFFHPANSQDWILDQYKRRLKKLDLYTFIFSR